MSDTQSDASYELFDKSSQRLSDLAKRQAARTQKNKNSPYRKFMLGSGLANFDVLKKPGDDNEST